ncbi:MAG: T9SS type A sorting domain-containing protein [Ginsengibacter sp.]
MKKKFTISVGLALVSFIGFAQNCPSYFKRNNGNGLCGSGSEIRMYYSTCPAVISNIDSIYVNGVNTNVTMNMIDASKCETKGYISYCLSSDIPPANTITVYFSSGTLSAMINTVCTVTDTPPSGGPMPVVLKEFNVQRKGVNLVSVTWTTAQEINSDRFEIQRSSNNSSFETVGTVSSKNSNSSLTQFYAFSDQNNLNEVIFYRIKMIDKDNTFKFSPIKTVKGSSGISDFTVFPNPSTGNARITITDLSEPSKVVIFDNSGRLIKQMDFNNSNSIDINNLQKGGYIIKVTGEKTGASSVKKLTVIN